MFKNFLIKLTPFNLFYRRSDFSSHCFPEVFHRLNEAAFPDSHHHIDRVIIFLTIKASGKVGVSVCGRVIVVTQRAAEAKPFRGMS
jgi:hypothetical protein